MVWFVIHSTVNLTHLAVKPYTLQAGTAAVTVVTEALSDGPAQIRGSSHDGSPIVTHFVQPRPGPLAILLHEPVTDDHHLPLRVVLLSSAVSTQTKTQDEPGTAM